jgi:hypothetical protein
MLHGQMAPTFSKFSGIYLARNQSQQAWSERHLSARSYAEFRFLKTKVLHPVLGEFGILPLPPIPLIGLYLLLGSQLPVSTDGITGRAATTGGGKTKGGDGVAWILGLDPVLPWR